MEATNTRLGNLLIANDGASATLTQNGLPSTALLLITLAKFFGTERPTSRVAKMQDGHVAELGFDYNDVLDAVTLRIHWDSHSHPALDFYTFHWKKPAELTLLQDALNLGGDSVYWYGGMNLLNLEWPLRKGSSYGMSEFVVNDIFQYTGTSGQERYWLSSKKVAVTVPWHVPLWTAIQGGELQLQAKQHGSQFLLANDFLEYMLTAPKDGKMSLRDFHQLCFKQFLKAPTDHPDLALMEKPIWSTWASYWTDVKQSDVLDYAKEIHAREFPILQLELDDMWTTKYGDYEINTEKFPDFEGMLAEIKDKYGVPRLTAWMHPFVNADSKNGQDMELRNRVFVRTRNGEVPLSWWWDCPQKGRDPTRPVGPDNPDTREPCAYVLDLTNPAAQEWWYAQLKSMQEKGIYTFKFDAGETNWLPQGYVLHSGRIPNDYSRDYAFFSARFGPAVENRFGSGSQQANIFMRTMDRNSYWDQNGGLFTLIPWALQCSLHGYYWNLPDMIGGNGLNHNETNIKGEPPEPELYIRWTQVNAFLLAMQFSYPPWHKNYGPEVAEHVKKVLAIRDQWMPYLLQCVKSAVQNQEPVIRPMWWASDEEEAYGCTDQYMVGNGLVVAPIVTRGQVKRDIFLPAGQWQDGNDPNGLVVEGPRIINEYSAPLDTLPFYFNPELTTSTTTEAAGTSTTTTQSGGGQSDGTSATATTAAGGEGNGANGFAAVGTTMMAATLLTILLMIMG